MSIHTKEVIMPGINFQYPYSKFIVERKKTLDTRLYPIPKQYLNKPLLIIETPGSSQTFKARLIGTVIVASCFKYKTKEEFDRDYKKHLVGPETSYYRDFEKKWGWILENAKPLKKIIEAPPKKGIKFTREIPIQSSMLQ